MLTETASDYVQNNCLTRQLAPRITIQLFTAYAKTQASRINALGFRVNQFSKLPQSI